MSALEDANRGVLIFDENLNVRHASNRFWSLLEISPDLLGTPEPISRLLSRSPLTSEAVSLAQKHLSSAENDKLVGLAIRNSKRNLLLSVRPLTRNFLAATFEEDRRSEMPVPAASLDMLNRDALTGIANRVFFEAAVARSLGRTPAVPISVMLVDLDRFKAVNDTLGHAAGDTLLKLAAERLQAAVRAGDVVARFGGDEFAVLIDPSPAAEEPARIGRRILDLVQRTYMIEGQLVNVGTSIGIAQSPSDGTDCKMLLKNADLALYQAKDSGRASFRFFDLSMEKRAMERRTNELELRKALAMRQLELFYQPQVDTPSQRLVGFEALIRWRHPVRGLIPPAMFLPLAEEIGVIVPIGEWVLRTACREAMNWPAELTIAVNASPLQFDAGNFADSVKQALRATGLPGERLEIEITEGILLRSEEAVLNTLHELRAMKVRIAMDDFGTGYASLSQLARFPFDKIKIDRSLAGFEGDDVKQRAIVRAITALGQSLGVCTLAEGVESADQLARLESDGCASVQGYFFGKPVPSVQLAEIISRLCPVLESQSIVGETK